jgi:hypothetical protein
VIEGKERIEPWEATEWKAVADRIKNDRGHICDRCGLESRYLKLHHRVYATNLEGILRQYWDYPDENFACLCGKCHDFVHRRHGKHTYPVENDKELLEKIAEIKFDFDKEKIPKPSLTKAEDQDLLSELCTDFQSVSPSVVKVKTRAKRAKQCATQVHCRIPQGQILTFNTLAYDLGILGKRPACNADVTRCLIALAEMFYKKNREWLMNLDAKTGFIKKNAAKIW